MPYSVGTVSLGCNKNRVDTEIALSLLSENGFTITSDPSQADILFVNTCGFIESAKQESIDSILEMASYKKTGKCILLIASGCLIQRYEKELLDALPEVDLFLGVNQYEKLPELIRQALAGKRISACQDNWSIPEHNRLLSTPFYSAYIRIGEGCSNCCTFCAIPSIRGPYRSRDEALILNEIRHLVDQGVREHILIAQDTTRYGMDHGSRSMLPDLMKKAAAISGVDWLRVLYCYPDETGEDLLDVLADTPNICPYLDIPIQHIHDEILRRMHRRGTRSDILHAIKGAKSRNLTLRTSLIVGFPGETEDQFQELLDFVEETEFDRLGAFVYSPEDGTPAAKMPDQIPKEIAEDRLDRLMRLQQKISERKNRSRINQEETVLITGTAGPDEWIGRSAREAPEIDGRIILRGNGSSPQTGSFVRARITASDIYDLKGVII